jgi:hypothetical protein
VALSVARGSFTLNTTTGNQVVSHGGAFTGKLVRFCSMTAAAGLVYCVGAATSSTARWALSGAADDAVTPSNAACAATDASCIRFNSSTAGGTTTEAADFVSFASGSFTINVTTAGAAKTIEFEVIGGTDFEAEVSHFSPGIVTGNLTVSGATFTRKALLLHGNVATEGAGQLTATSAHLCQGAATSSTARWAMAAKTRDAQAAADSASLAASTRCYMSINAGGNTVRQEQDFVSFGAADFTINRITSNAGEIYYVCMGGTAQYWCTSAAQPGTTGNQSLTGAGFTPALDLFASGGKTDSITPTDHWRHFTGSAISSTDRAVIASTDTDAANPTENAGSRATTKCLRTVTGGAPSIAAEADLVSQDADGITINWSTADATARLFGVMGLAAAAAAGGGGTFQLTMVDHGR